MCHHPWFMLRWGEGMWDDVVHAGQARYQWNLIPAAVLSSISDLPLYNYADGSQRNPRLFGGTGGGRNELTLPIGSNWKLHCLMIISLLVGTASRFSCCSLRCT